MLVDFSEPMLERAHAALLGRGARRSSSSSRISRPVTGLPSSATARSTRSSPASRSTTCRPQRKRALFDEVARLLAPGGQFVNMDIVATEGPLDGLFFECMEARAAAGRASRSSSTATRTCPTRSSISSRGSKRAGFEQVEVHFKWAEAAILGAVKPF